MNMFIKVLKSIKNGEFWKKLERRRKLYWITNKNVRALADSQCAYDRLYKKYNYILERGIENIEEGKPGDTVWICWFQGEEKAPPLVKACISSIRRNIPDHKIVVLSNETIPNYIQFPDYIIEKRSKGIIPNAQYSDLVRIELLCRYGGLWVDSTVLCTGQEFPQYVLQQPLFVYKQFDLVRKDMTTIVASSWLIAAYNNQKILLMTRNLLWEYWKCENQMENYFIFHLFFAMSTRKYKTDWDRLASYNNHGPHTLQFELEQPYNTQRWAAIKRISDFHKLNNHNDYTKSKCSFYDYIIQEYKPQNE